MDLLTLRIQPHLEHLALGVKHLRAKENGEMYFHDHTFSELVFVLHSSGAVHWAEGKSAVLKRGDVLLLHPGQVHAYENNDDLEIVNLLYDAEKIPLPLLDGHSLDLFSFMVSPRRSGTLSPELPLVTLTESQLLQIAAELEDLEYEFNQSLPGGHLRCLVCFINILIYLGRAGGGGHSGGASDSAVTALAYLNRHFREPVPNSTLARLSCLSERSLFLRFRELTGYSPQEYRRRKQIEYAAELLKNSRYSIARIAGECGFCDSNHLIKRFSAGFGCPPGVYRKKNAR